jgi:hypothetical protein
MMKNKKIISLICALAMIFTMLSGFSVLADDAKGISLAGSLSDDGKTITLDATAVGTNGTLNNFMVAVNVPDGVTLDDVTVSDDTLTTNIADGVLYVAFLDLTGKGKSFTDNKLVTIEIALDSALSSDYVATLTGDAAIEDTDGAVDVDSGTMTAASTTVAKWQDPNKKPDTVERPAKEEASSDSEVPSVVPVEGKGIQLDASIDSTNTVITVDATAVGTNGTLNNFMVALELPTGVTLDDITVSDDTLTTNVADGVLYVAFLDLTGKGKTFEDNKLVTITINLPEALTAPLSLSLTDDAAIEDTDGAVDCTTGMTKTNAVVTPSTEEPKTVKTVPLKSYVGDGKTAADAAKAAQDADKTVYLTVDVKLKDGTDAVYGVDYAAEYPAGTVLTKEEYNNLIHGYTDADMADVINNLKFRVYNSDVATISTTLNAVGDESQLVDPVEDKTIGKTTTTSTPAPASPSITVTGKVSGSTKDVKTVEVDKIITLTATVANLKDGQEGGTYTFELADTNSESLLEQVNVDSTNGVVKYQGTKTGTATVTVTYSKDDVEIASTDVAIKVTKASTSSSSSSSSSSSGNGGIAYGSTTTGTSSAKIAFTDIDTVPWAEDAILALVDKGVINGRSESIFDPNGTVTRAEFAKMVVLAFNLTGGNGVDQFSDVETTDWYAQYVARGYYNGVISGYDDGTFRPNGLISRQEMAAMISRAINAANKTLPATVAAESFSDADQIGDWAIDAVTSLQQGGVINGMGDGTYAPADNATRAQAAVIINRAITNAQ